MTAGRLIMERLLRVDTTSLSDADKSLRVLPAAIRPIATGRRMIGRAVTAVAGGDLASVFEAVGLGGEGDVLVIAEAGHSAVVGELVATDAIRRGMAGIVVDGLVRDTATLVQLPLGVYARGITPRAAPAVAAPVVQVPVIIGGIEIQPGDLLVGDDDGVLVATLDELEAAIDTAEAIQAREVALRADIEAGASVLDRLGFVSRTGAG